MSNQAAKAFDALSAEDRLSLLVTLGFPDPMRYQGMEEMDLRYGCFLYEVQIELDRCYQKGKWVPRQADEPAVKNAPKRKRKRTPRLKKAS